MRRRRPRDALNVSDESISADLPHWRGVLITTVS